MPIIKFLTSPLYHLNFPLFLSQVGELIKFSNNPLSPHTIPILCDLILFLRLLLIFHCPGFMQVHSFHFYPSLDIPAPMPFILLLGLLTDLAVPPSSILTDLSSLSTGPKMAETTLLKTFLVSTTETHNYGNIFIVFSPLPASKFIIQLWQWFLAQASYKS